MWKLIVSANRRTALRRYIIAGRRTALPRMRSSTVVRSFSSSDFFGDLLQGMEYDNKDLKHKPDSSKATQEPPQTQTWSPQKDPWDLEEIMESTIGYEQLPDWDVSYVSRISQERVFIHPDKIPTLQTLATLPLPPPDPNQETNKLYALQRQRKHYQYIQQQVKSLAEARVQQIRAIREWEEKQDAVDVLFEQVESQLKEREVILGKHPKFATWVERALEEYLKDVQKEASVTTDDGDADDTAVPVFMDCFAPDDDASSVVPKILLPLKPRPNNTSVGKMVEEWELAAHKTTKRILLRQSTRQIAKALLDDSTRRIYVHGAAGTGKTAALAAIVASARMSGAIVLYLPHGDDLHKNGFYLEPNAKREGLFDLPVLSKNACEALLTSHGDALKSIPVSEITMENVFTSDQLKTVEKGDLSAADLLKHGVAKLSHAPMVYAVVVETLMNQDQVDFIMVLDEFNCYFEKSHYYHMEYDNDVKKPVPYDQITLFKPALDAMGISNKNEELPVEIIKEPLATIKRGAIVVATTESHAIARKVTDALTADAKKQQHPPDAATGSLQLVAVPTLSSIEVDHMLAHYEATGVGKLRLDRGDTVMNEQEVARLRMLSGGVAQKLMDACIM